AQKPRELGTVGGHEALVAAVSEYDLEHLRERVVHHHEDARPGKPGAGLRHELFSLSRPRDGAFMAVARIVRATMNGVRGRAPALRTVTCLASAQASGQRRGGDQAAIARRTGQANPRMTLATAFRSAMKSFISCSRAASSGARRIEDGWTVAITCGASDDGISFPRCCVTLKVGAISAWAAVAPRHTTTCGFRIPISASSHRRHAAISLRFGFSCRRRFPAGRHLKCFTAFVTYTVSRSIPAASSASSSTRPAGPTN